MSESKAYPGERGEVLPVSPLPWLCEHPSRRVIRAAVDGGIVASTSPLGTSGYGEQQARDAEYIVEACNSYPALRERVRQLEGCLREAYDVLGPKTVLGELLPVADAAAQPDPALSGDEWALAYRRMGWKIARALLESVSPVSGVSPEKGRATP